LADGDAVARLGKQLGDAPRIGREDRCRAILVDRNLALGDMLGPEFLPLNGLGRERRPFRLARPVEPLAALGLAGELGIGRLALFDGEERKAAGGYR
jgi:hypothetical protein